MMPRDACKECIYYISENQTCQRKKCSGWGAGYVTKFDRRNCEPVKKEETNG